MRGSSIGSKRKRSSSLEKSSHLSNSRPLKRQDASQTKQFTSSISCASFCVEKRVAEEACLVVAAEAEFKQHHATRKPAASSSSSSALLSPRASFGSGVPNFSLPTDIVYAEDLCLTHKENEAKMASARTPRGLDGVQVEVTQQMRAILVDWMVEVSCEYNMSSQTLFLAVNYVDRLLEKIPFARSTLQLLGITCILLAAKYEEVHAPLIEELVEVTDGTYTREEILRMELILLNTLKFELTVSTTNDFLTAFLAASDTTDPRVVAHACYVAEMILPLYSLQHEYLPSELAASIVCFSRCFFDLPVWSDKFERVTGYSRARLRPIVHQLFDAYRQITSAPTGNFTAAREKYRHPMYCCAADVPMPLSCPL